ncbi:MAG: hypothetical protein BWY66_01933 [bacterium ADurb.Bin374]|nr:MAG: hypothetical protein BWY66_01933 [bacterium ADurb.Bin374]
MSSIRIRKSSVRISLHRSVNVRHDLCQNLAWSITKGPNALNNPSTPRSGAARNEDNACSSAASRMILTSNVI